MAECLLEVFCRNPARTAFYALGAAGCVWLSIDLLLHDPGWIQRVCSAVIVFSAGVLTFADAMLKSTSEILEELKETEQVRRDSRLE